MAITTWVLRGLQDKQKENLQTDSLVCLRFGFRMSCHFAVSRSWDLFQIDQKTKSFLLSRDVVCQLTPKEGQPPNIVAILKKPARGLNGAPRS